MSASVVVLERRQAALDRAFESADYAFFAGNIESVGWRAGDKKAVPVYLRDQRNGDLILDDENEPILDADFGKVLNDFLHSLIVDCFPWSVEDRDVPANSQTQGIAIAEIVCLFDLNLDPKRHSFKFNDTRRAIKRMDHFCLGDVLEIVPAARIKIDPARMYRYVEIERVGIGEYDYAEFRGWQLPLRAKLPAKPGDFFIPHVWSCAGKWFIAAGDCNDLIVTNGCTRLRLKEGQADILPDLVVGLCSEAFCVQIRGLATGSDGLAEIVDDDLLSIVLPKVLKPSAREKVSNQMEPMLSGESTFSKFAKVILDDMPQFPAPSPRKSHCALV